MHADVISDYFHVLHLSFLDGGRTERRIFCIFAFAVTPLCLKSTGITRKQKFTTRDTINASGFTVTNNCQRQFHNARTTW